MASKRFVLVGHAGFYNRGCEAIVRTTAQMLRQRFPGCEIILVSSEARDDRRQKWADDLEILDGRVARWSGLWLGWQVRKLLLQDVPPIAQLPLPVRRAILTADAVLQIGGDNLTSEYGLRPNSALLGPNELALQADIPLVIWGASVGPFDSPELEALVMRHLRRAALITVRESVTADYLQNLDVAHNVVRGADPAMLLEPEPIDLSPFWPDAEHVVGLNISPLSCRYRGDGDQNFGRELVRVVTEEVLSWDDWGLLLIPHVIKPPLNDDHQFMAEVIEAADYLGRVRVLPPKFDARQTKYIISQCDLLMAARTHATIAGFSSGVPTISLAYSRKAHGINMDLFGSDEWLLDLRTMPDTDEALPVLRRMRENRDAVAAQLQQKKSAMSEAAKRCVHELARMVGE